MKDEEKRSARRNRIDSFIAFLKELTPSEITHTARWIDVRERLEAMKDPRYQVVDLINSPPWSFRLSLL